MSDTRPIKPRDALLLRYVKDYQSDTGGVSPSFEELRQVLGCVSKSVVKRALDRLEEAGKIRRIPNRSRAIEIVQERFPLSADPITAIPIYRDGDFKLMGFLP